MRLIVFYHKFKKDASAAYAGGNADVSADISNREGGNESF
jgi:hypothetical protein